MNLNNVLFGIVLAASFDLLAATPAPVFNANANASSPVSITDQLAILDRKLDARNRAQIAIQQQLDDLQNEVDELRGVTELHTHQLSQVLDRQRELYQELDRRVAQALKLNNQANTAPTTVTANAAQPYSSNLNENELYDHAVNLVLKDKQYDQAIIEFTQFNQKYPHSSYAANAHYWLGQLLFTKADFSAAKKEFSIVVTQFKDSSKREDALLKLALVAQKDNNQSRMVSLYKQVIAEYPNSTAAKLAQARLDNGVK